MFYTSWGAWSWIPFTKTLKVTMWVIRNVELSESTACISFNITETGWVKHSALRHTFVHRQKKGRVTISYYSLLSIK